MATPATRFSLRNVLVIVIPCALLAYGANWYLTQEVQKPVPHGSLDSFLRMHLKASTELDEGLIDDGNLVAAPPSDPSKRIDPDTLVFCVLGEDLDKEKATFADLTKHLGKATGKKVDLIVSPESFSDQLAQLRDGKIHIASFSTGAVSMAVNKGGFVPVCLMADEAGKYGYEMQIIVPENSPVKTPADLKGSSISFVSSYSHSGFKAPIVILWKEFSLQPGRDYHPSNAGTQKMVAQGVAKKELKAGAVASDLLTRWTASGEIDGKAIRTIYTSSVNFPTACFGYAHQLKPELADKIKTAFLDFHFKGTSLETQYAAEGKWKFVPISYKTAWEPVRKIDEQATKLVETELAKSKSAKK